MYYDDSSDLRFFLSLAQKVAVMVNFAIRTLALLVYGPRFHAWCGASKAQPK